MFDGYREVDVGVVLAVVGAVPCFVVHAASNYEERSRARPLALVGGADGVAEFGALDYDEAPGLVGVAAPREARYYKQVPNVQFSDIARSIVYQLLYLILGKVNSRRGTLPRSQHLCEASGQYNLVRV